MKLHFRKLGSGPAIIILHGIYGSGDNWYSIARTLSSYFSVYLVDQRNHGLSPHDDELNYEAMTSDLKRFFNDNQLDKAIIVGHSMGGKVAMNFALQHATLVDKLVIIDIALRSYVNSSNLLVLQEMADALISLDIEHAQSREEIDNGLAVHIPKKGIRQYLLKNLKRDEHGVFYWGMNLKTINNSTFEILDKIETANLSFNRPTLIIRGTKSDYINVDDILLFRKVFPVSTLHELDANHWVHVEKPKEVTILLMDFLRTDLAG